MDTGVRMFLFGSERDYALVEPMSILQAVWTTADDNSRHSLWE
jgi:hypothetical protein